MSDSINIKPCGLDDLPLPVLAHVLSYLRDASAVVRACCSCRALYTVLRAARAADGNNTNGAAAPAASAAQCAGVDALTVRSASATLARAAAWLPLLCPNVRRVDASRAPACSEAWLAVLLARLPAVEEVCVCGLGGWGGGGVSGGGGCGAVALPLAVARRLRALDAGGTALEIAASTTAASGGRSSSSSNGADASSSWPEVAAALTRLTRLSLAGAGAATGLWRCRRHGRLACRDCATAGALLPALVAANTGLVSLDLSDLAKESAPLIELALAAAAANAGGAAAARLRHLSIARCPRAALLPPHAPVLAHLVSLDVSGAAVDDAGAALIAARGGRLRELRVSGCFEIGDAGILSLARLRSSEDDGSGQAATAAAAIGIGLRPGRLRALGVARLPRVSAKAFEAVFAAVAGGGKDSSSSSSSNYDSSSSSSSSSDSDLNKSNPAAARQQRRQCRRRRRQRRNALWLDISGSGGANGAALMAFVSQSPPVAAAATRQPQQQQLADSDDELAATLQQLGLDAGPVSNAGNGSTTNNSSCARPLRALLAAGCQVSAADVAALADAGALTQLRALDLGHCEPLRRPAPPPAVALAGALVGAACGGALRVLRLDNCHSLDDAAAELLAARLGSNLRELSLIGCRPIGDRGMAALVGGSASTLRALSIGGGGARQWREAALAAAAAPLAALTRLRVARRSHLEDAELAPLLAAAPRLEALSLAACYSLAGSALAAAAASLREVEAVAMGPEFSGAALAALPHLRRARLAACPGVAPRDVQVVAARCPQLAELRLPARLWAARESGGSGGGSNFVLPSRGSDSADGKSYGERAPLHILVDDA